MRWCGLALIEVALAARAIIDSGGNLAEPIWVHGDAHDDSQLRSSNIEKRRVILLP
jgi:hypothetical protein